MLVPVTASGPRNAGDLAGAGVTLSCAFIPEGAPSIEFRFNEVFSVPWLLALAVEAERDGVDALVIDCMGDPGLAPLREAVRIPVVPGLYRLPRMRVRNQIAIGKGWP